MALNRSEKINLVQMAMKRVNVVPYGENQIAFGTNNEKIILGESAVTICESYINIPDEKHTCHVGFSVLKSDFYIEVDGNERSKIYKNSNKTMQFFDLFLLGKELHCSKSNSGKLCGDISEGSTAWGVSLAYRD